MKNKIVEIPKEKFEQFCKDVLTLMAGIGWFNVEEEENRAFKFIEENCPEALQVTGEGKP